MNEETVIGLSKPLRFGDEEISELRLRRPTGGDFRHVKASNEVFAMALDLTAALTGLPQKVIDSMDVEDLFKVVMAVSYWLPKSQETGETS